MKRITTLLIALLSLFMVACFSASAEGENAQTAVPIELEENFEILFNEDIYEYYLKFIPEETAWYEISLEDYVADETYITTYDYSGDEIGFGYWDEFSNKCSSTVELNANETYYINISCYSEDGFVVTGTIIKHTHNLKQSYIWRADNYSEGTIGNECTTCEYTEEIPIPKVNINLSKEVFTFNRKTQKPTVTVTDSTGKIFVEGTDYTVSYPKSSINVDYYELTVTMENEYYNVNENLYYEIEPKSINDLTIELSKSTISYGEKAPTVTIANLKENTDFVYDMWYWGLGEHKVTIYGIENYTGEKEVSFTVIPANVSGLKVAKTSSSYIELSWKEDENYSTQYYQIYDVKKKKIIKTVSSDNLSYTIKNLKAGTTYSFKVRGYSKENGEKYYGEWETITGVTRPASISLTSLKSSKAKTFTAKWDKQTSATGYQIQYSTSSKFSSYKTVKVSKNSSTSKTVSSLKSGKKYYVRIRTYKTVKINGKSKTVYSSWSKAKSITIKK